MVRRAANSERNSVKPKAAKRLVTARRTARNAVATQDKIKPYRRTCWTGRPSARSQRYFSTSKRNLWSDVGKVFLKRRMNKTDGLRTRTARGLKRSPWKEHFTFAGSMCSIGQELKGGSFSGNLHVTFQIYFHLHQVKCRSISGSSGVTFGRWS